jgi:hypothetical protein
MTKKKTLDLVMNITVTVPVPDGKSGEDYYGTLINKSDNAIIKLLKEPSTKMRLYTIEDFDGSCDVKINGKEVIEEPEED